MSGASRSTRYAVMGFVLMTAVVIGGMSWATASQLKLAKVRLEVAMNEQMGSRLIDARSRLDRLIAPMIFRESGREFREYQSFVPEDIYHSGDEQSTSDRQGFVRSELLPGPPADRVELHFQVGPDWRWTSPQLLDDPEPWQEGVAALLDLDNQVRIEKKLDEISRALTVPQLGKLLAQAQARNRVGLEVRDPVNENPSAAPKPISPTPGGKGSDRVARVDLQEDLRRRGRVYIDNQMQSLPTTQCDPLDTHPDVPQWLARPRSGAGEETLLSPVEVPPPMTPLWIDLPESGGKNLALVREVYADGARYYQGLLINWSKLKSRMLDDIRDLFPEADLVPVVAGERIEDKEGTLVGPSLPARLVVPDTTDEASYAAAWNDVRGTILATWAAALVILVGAGIGVRNLIALTNRRIQFAYAVTHELRTPLTTFRLYSDMLAAGLVPGESRQHYLDTLNTESQRLSTLVENVLEYARLENHRVRLNPVKTRIGALGELIGGALKERCHQTKVEPVIRNGIPEDQAILTDVDVVRQIMGVVINNACRHARESKHPKVVLDLGWSKGRMNLDVVDSGTGVDRRDARSLFKPFRRGRKAEASAMGGIGLGLALARDWAKLLGGKLELISGSDDTLGGAHFRLSIPAPTQAPIA